MINLIARLQQKPLLLWSACGVLLGLAMLSPLLSLLLIPGLLLFFYGLDITTTRINLFWYSTLAGTLKSMGALAWLWQMDPAAWHASTHTAASVAVLCFYWLSASLVIGLGLSCTVLVFVSIRRFSPSIWLTLPLLWVLGEAIGSALFSLYSWAPHIPLHAGMSFGYIGYPLVQLPILTGFAVLGGVYGLGLVTVLCVLLVYKLLVTKRAPVLLAALCAVCILSYALTTLLVTTEQQNRTVLIAETDYSLASLNTQAGFARRTAEAKNMVRDALQLQSDYIVLPEHSNFTRNFSTPQKALTYIEQQASSEVVLIDTLATSSVRNKRTLRSYTYTTKDPQVYVQEKSYLVPHGEYLPVYHQLFLELFTPRTTWEKFVQNKNFLPRTINTLNPDLRLPSVLFCYESLVPWQAKNLAIRSEIPFIAHTVSHGWFKGASILEHQQSLMLRTQAIFSQTHIIQATNMGPHAVYEPTGQVSYGELVSQSGLWRLYTIDI